MNRNRTVVVVVAAALLAGVMFGAGYLAAAKLGGGGTGAASAAGGQRGPGGAFAQLTEAERQQLASMSAEERTRFFKDKGIEMPAGGPAMGEIGANGRGMARTALIEGTVLSATSEQASIRLASGGSSTVYIDEDTVVAAVSGKRAEVVKGASVLVYAQPEAEGVTAAKAIVVR